MNLSEPYNRRNVGRGLRLTFLAALAAICLGFLAKEPQPARAWEDDLMLGWTTSQETDSYAVDLGDYDADGDLDIALGNYLQDSQIYRNDGAGIFTLVWSSLVTDTRSIDWGDYDNDGDLDLAVGGSKIQVFRNNGGEFSLAWSEPVGHLRRSVVWGDWDLDDQLDLVTGGYGDCIRIYQNGSITDTTIFTETWTSGNSLTIEDIKTFDWEGDGDLDLVVGLVDKGFSIYTNAGAPGYDLGLLIKIPVPGQQVWSVDLGDWDNDGDKDLAVGIYNGKSLVYEWENITGFKQAWEAPFSAGTLGITWGDYDGDGDRDLVLGNQHGDSLQVYQNNTVENPAVLDAGRLTLTWISAEDLTVQHVAWGDVDGDTDLDLVVANQGLSAIYYNGAGPLTLAWSSIESDKTRDIAWGDWDNDGDLDLAVANWNGFSRVYQNDDGTFNLAWSAPETANGNAVAWGDYDLDGYLDLVVGNWYSPTWVYHNVGGGLELAWSLSNNTRVTCAAWGDYDGDKDLDLLFGTSSGTILLYKNTGGVFAQDWSSTKIGLIASAVWGDYDDDGWLDLAVGWQSSTSLYHNDAGELTEAWTDSTKSGGNLAWGDWEGDGDLDLAYGGTTDNYIYGNDAGSFTVVWTTKTNHEVTSLAWGDYDGDGDLDLAFGYNDSPSTIYRNNSRENLGVLDAARLTLAWTVPAADYPLSLAWGDYDGDGDLDLALGNDGQPNRVYRNETTRLALDNTSGETDSSQAVAWGDYDGDGDLDLAVGNFGSPSRVYHYDITAGGELILAWTAPTAYDTQALAWGDYDGDGKLDLFLGNSVEQNRLYRNTGGSFMLAWTDPQLTPKTRAVAWGDYDGDGDLDLALGYAGRPTAIYRNTGSSLAQAWTAPLTDTTYSVAWSDYDLDGDLDLAVGNAGSPNRLYCNDRGAFTLTWSAPLTNTTYGVAWGDYDGDGDPDLAVGNNGSPSQVYRNDSGALVLAWNSPGATQVTSVAWVDYDNDGDLDLAMSGPSSPPMIYRNNGGLLGIELTLDLAGVNEIAWSDYDLDGDPDLATANASGPNFFYQNRTANGLRLTGLTTARIAYPAGPAAPTYASATILEGPTINIEYTLYDDQGDAAREVQAYYSLDGGSLWQPAIATTDTITTNLEATLTGTLHTYTWDVYGSDFFGYSDQVIFRLDVYQGMTNLGPYQRALTTARSLPFRARGAQVRVTDANDIPVSGALVYRLPYGETGDFEAYDDLAGNPYTTDLQGYLQGRGALGIGDQLVALYPISTTQTAVLYYTSAAPTADGLEADEVEQPGTQVLKVLDANPLLLFNLSISLEWDARQDAQFLAQLQADLQRTSEFLYDWSNGQATLGQVTIYHAREQWNEAHIRIYASNRLRPNASLGGIVSESLVDPDPTPLTITYYPGQVYMGASWTRYGDPGGSLGEDWPRALAHELGHYAFFLDDSYLGLDYNGLLISVDPALCPGAMSDPYRQDLPFDEFHAEAGWSPSCDETLPNLSTGRWDWETIATFYPALAVHDPANDPNPGPADLPLAVMAINFVEPIAPPNGLTDPTFYLALDGSSYRPGPRARVFLFSGDQITDLGRPVLDTVLARGAAAGDRLCVFENEQGVLGCEWIAPPDQQLDLFAAADWQPQVLVTPVTSQTTHITVTNLLPEMSLNARLYPQGAPAGSPITLTWTGSAYEGDLPSTAWVLAGYVHVWVNEATPQREMVTDFSLGGSPIPEHIGSNTLMRGRFAPAVSADGQVILFSDVEFGEDEFYAIQSAVAVPEPPTYATLVGQAYYLMASPGAPNLDQTSISISYMASEVPDGEEIWLRIYYWDGTQWLIQPTNLNTAQNMASARCLEEAGLYALMSSVEVPLQQGWNNIAFPIPVTRTVTDTLASISGTYGLVYHYSGEPADPWQLYAPDAPGWVNDPLVFEFAQGYWISATQAITLYLKGGFGGLLEGGIESGAPYPPATYYGVVQTSAYFTPTDGMQVEAYVEDVLCGQGLSLEIGGQVVYVVSVAAEVQTIGCGRPGGAIRFQIAGQPLLPQPAWNNDRLWEVALYPNAAPQAANDLVATPEDTPLAIEVLTNDSDMDGDTLSIAAVSNPLHGIAVINGTDVFYTPALNYNGSDTFTYTLTDGYLQDTASVNVTISSVNDAPEAAGDTAITVEDVAVTVDVLANDSDPDGDDLAITALSSPLHGTAVISGTGDAAVVIYTAAPNYFGSDTFNYTLSDGGLQDTAVVNITILPANDAPMAVSDTADTAEDVAVTIDILANDSDPEGDNLSIVALGNPLHGTAVISGTGATALVFYTPAPDYNGSDTFNYTLSDGTLQATAAVNVAVSPINDAPVAAADAAETAQGVAIIIDVLANDSDVDGDSLSIVTLGNPLHGTAVISDTEVLYTPEPDYSGSDAFTYTLSDGSLQATAGVDVIIASSNQVPVAAADYYTTTLDTTLVIAAPGVLANDIDPDGDGLGVILESDVATGWLSLSADGLFIYIPAPGFSGVVTFTYCASDGIAISQPVTVQIVVEANQAVYYHAYLPLALR